MGQIHVLTIFANSTYLVQDHTRIILYDPFHPCPRRYDEVCSLHITQDQDQPAILSGNHISDKKRELHTLYYTLKAEV